MDFCPSLELHRLMQPVFTKLAKCQISAQLFVRIYTILQKERMWWSGAAPITNHFRMENKARQTTYHFKGNLSEILNQLFCSKMVGVCVCVGRGGPPLSFILQNCIYIVYVLGWYTYFEAVHLFLLFPRKGGSKLRQFMNYLHKVLFKIFYIFFAS